MKKALVLGTVLMLMVTAAGSVQAADQPVIGKIVRLRGTAFLHQRGKIKPLPVVLGLEVRLHDRINTAAGSKLRIELKDGSLLAMGPKGELHLDEFDFDTKTKQRSAFFRMAIGKLRVFARQLTDFKRKSFRIKTPTAVCGVRGTLFLVWVQSQTITQVVCLDNMVEVANVLDPTDFVVLSPNMATDIAAGQAPTEPILVTPEQLDQLQLDLADLGDETATEETTTEETTTEETTTEETTTEETTTEATTTEETTTEATTTESTTTAATTTEATTTAATTTEASTTTTAPTTTTRPTSTTTTTAPTTTTTTRPTTTSTSTTSTTSTTTTTTTSTTSTTTTSSTTTTLPWLVLPAPPGAP